MSSALQPTIFIIVGITGDLAKRKLLPAIEQIAKASELPDAFKIVGITRRDVSVEEVLANVSETNEGQPLSYVSSHLEMYRMNLEDAQDYSKLKQYLQKLDEQFESTSQKLFYLSVPPQMSEQIVEQLGEAGFSDDLSTKLLLEKPFGSDYRSAEDMIIRIRRYFKEEQVYRIDHYLAKEMAQNIVVFRNGNSLFRQSWNRSFIERIEIIASESIGIEGRTVFYEQTGALRDFIQNHLMQLAALTLMELPENEEWNSDVPSRRLAALQSLHLNTAKPLTLSNLRGQYRGYQDEVQNPGSTTETYASVTVFSDSPKWQGVPITLAAGKALAQKFTEVRVYYRKQHGQEADRLTFRLQPKEGVELELWSKKPGYSRELIPVHMQFNYHEQAVKLPEAYEQVIVDAIRSDHTLFTTSEEVLASWRILQPLQSAWSLSNQDLKLYQQGTSYEKLIDEA